jgi:regulator of sirC expression with transglutaminase-like and TPR domain
VLTLPEHEIDIGTAVLLAAQDERSDVDERAYHARLDALAARVRRRLPEGVSVAEAVEQLVRVVQPAGVASGRAEVGADSFPAEIDACRIAEGARGNCLGISLLYLAVAERVGLPVYGVSAPEHFFVRLDDGITKVNIEPTRGGRWVSDKEYRRWRAVCEEAEQRGIYLRSESKRQVIASLLANRAGYRASAGRCHEAIEDAERALAIKPYWPQAYVNRGLAYEGIGQRKRAEEDYYRALRLDPHCAGALNNLAALFVRRAAEGTDCAPGSAESAAKYIERALDLCPGRAEFLETAAAVAAARGDLRLARKRLKRAVQLEPAQARYRALLRETEKRIAGGAVDQD